jgi:hypothetical protein
MLLNQTAYLQVGRMEFHFNPKIQTIIAVNMLISVMKNENICAGFKL